MYQERCPSVVKAISENLKLLNGKRLSFDLDGIGQATYSLALNNASHELKKSILKEDLTTYWQLDNIARQNGIYESESMNFTRRVYNQESVYRDSPVIPGFKTLLGIVNEVQWEIDLDYVFISSRPAEFLDTTKSWFNEVFPYVNGNSIKIGRPTGMSGGLFKSLMIKENNVALHIEDAVDEALMIDRLTDCKIIIVPQPWNINISTFSDNIKRLSGYNDNSGVWPLIRFLSGREAMDFLKNS